MARTNSFGYNVADSTRSTSVLERLKSKNITKLTIARDPYPTTLSAFLEALQSNQSVREVAWTTHSVLEDVELLPSSEVGPYIDALASLPNISTVLFYGCWEDTTLCLLLGAIERNTQSRTVEFILRFWTLARWKITSQETLQRLTEVIRKLSFGRVELKCLEVMDASSVSHADINPLIQALIGESREATLPIIAASSAVTDTLVQGTVPTLGLYELLHSQQLQELLVGHLLSSRLYRQSSVGFLDDLAAFSYRNRQSALRSLTLFLSKNIPLHDYQNHLLPFCRRSPQLVLLKVEVENGPKSAIPLREKYPVVADALEFELSINASGIRQMLLDGTAISKRQWVDLLWHKRDDVSVFYYVLRQNQCLLS